MLIAKLADHICADFFFTSLEISNANLKEENTKWLVEKETCLNGSSEESVVYVKYVIRLKISERWKSKQKQKSPPIQQAKKYKIIEEIITSVFLPSWGSAGEFVTRECAYVLKRQRQVSIPKYFAIRILAQVDCE